MPRFAAFLRGVNVGKGNRVPMAAFRHLLEDLGFAEVRTLLNSGNAVFTASGRSGARHAHAIAAALQETCGVAVPVIVKSAAELVAIIDGSPMEPPEAEHSRLLVALGQDQSALRSLEPLLRMVTGPDRLVITSRAAYLHCPAGVLASSVGAAMLGKAGRQVTTRNWATILKVGALLRAAAAEAILRCSASVPSQRFAP